MAPTLSPALFSHPPLAAQCLGYVRYPPSSPSLSAERRKIPFSIEGYPMPQIVAFAGPSGPAFSFSAFLLPARPLACVDGLVFSHPGSPLSRIRPQLPHTPPTGSVWGFAGVVPLPGPHNRTQGHTGPCLVFTVFFSHLFSSVIPLVAAPGDNSPHREWEGSYKAASRFSQCRLMSTPLSARFR